jgi:N-acetyl-1-D-myo-inositol-2-amino-2-deoxy-alpha-D-glucopyranoside deacetylase
MGPDVAREAATPGLLCVHPHPDDETISCGGVLARAVDAGARVAVVTCTGGEAGDNLAGIDLGHEDLATHRRRELAAALAVLGVPTHRWLGYRDSGMVGTPANDHPDCFHRADTEAAALRLAAIVRELRPDAVVSDAADGTYGHPDHVKAHAVTVRAVELAADPHAPVDGEPWAVRKRYEHTLSHGRLRGAHEALVAAGLPSPFGEDATVLPFGTEDARVTTVVDVVPQLERKRAALAAHASQIGADSFFFNLPEDVVARFFGVEEFVLAHGRPVPRGDAGPEDDLLAGCWPGDAPGGAAGDG